MAEYPNANGIAFQQLRRDLFSAYTVLVEEKAFCAQCKRGGRCKEPHAKPYKTLAWASGIRQSSVETEVAAAYDDLRNEKKDIMREHEAEVLRSLTWVEAEAMHEWERSKLPFTEIRSGSETSGAAIESGASQMRDRRTKAYKILREQTGDCGYLSAVLAVQRQRREIWGLDAPKRIIPLNPDGTGMLQGLLELLAQSTASNVIDITPREQQQQVEYLDVDDVPVDSGNGTHAGNGSG